MNSTTSAEESEKAAMKRLREARKETVAVVSARVREQKKAMGAIKEQLRDHPMTVPEISGATGIPSADVLWYVAALKKYGFVVEVSKDGGYFRYQMAENGSEPR
jgi:biotin operon repressor